MSFDPCPALLYDTLATLVTAVSTPQELERLCCYHLNWWANLSACRAVLGPTPLPNDHLVILLHAGWDLVCQYPTWTPATLLSSLGCVCTCI